MSLGGMNGCHASVGSKRENAEAEEESIFVPPFEKGLTTNGSNYQLSWFVN
jgi:hypothetical protein